MSIDFKNKRELTFLGIGILMLIIVISGITFSIYFLVDNINQMFDKDRIGIPTDILEFQIEKAEGVLSK
jgi:hypothetical protein